MYSGAYSPSCQGNYRASKALGDSLRTRKTQWDAREPDGIRETTESTRFTRMDRCAEWCAKRYKEHDMLFHNLNAIKWGRSHIDIALTNVVAASILDSAPSNEEMEPSKRISSLGMPQTRSLHPLSLVKTDSLFDVYQEDSCSSTHSTGEDVIESAVAAIAVAVPTSTWCPPRNLVPWQRSRWKGSKPSMKSSLRSGESTEIEGRRTGFSWFNASVFLPKSKPAEG